MNATNCFEKFSFSSILIISSARQKLERSSPSTKKIGTVFDEGGLDAWKRQSMLLLRYNYSECFCACCRTVERRCLFAVFLFPFDKNDWYSVKRFALSRNSIRSPLFIRSGMLHAWVCCLSPSLAWGDRSRCPKCFFPSFVFNNDFSAHSFVYRACDSNDIYCSYISSLFYRFWRFARKFISFIWSIGFFPIFAVYFSLPINDI